MGAIAAVVPIKMLASAKTRLSAAFGAEERASLALWMLERVVGAVQAAGVVEQVAVVSPDARALAQAIRHGAVALRQEHGTLNQGLALGREWARSVGADALMVLLGDLPLLHAEEVRGVVALARDTWTPERGGVVIAPDRAEIGTNVLLLRPPGGLPFAFGRESYALHSGLARERGLSVGIFHAPGTAFDLDMPADVEALRAKGIALPEALARPRAPVGGSGDGRDR